MTASYLSCGHPCIFLGVSLASDFELPPNALLLPVISFSPLPSHPPPAQSFMGFIAMSLCTVSLPGMICSRILCEAPVRQSAVTSFIGEVRWSIFSLTSLPPFFTQDYWSICYDNMVENRARFSLTYFSVWMASVPWTA